MPKERLTVDDLKKEHFKVDAGGNLTINNKALSEAVKGKLLDRIDPQAIRVSVDTG